MTSYLLTAFYAVTMCVTDPCPDAAEASPWDLIAQITYEEVDRDGAWAVEKTIPDALRAQAADFEITGHYVPVEAQAYVKSFLLVPDPDDCPFCGQSGYGPSLEVTLKRPVRDLAEGAEITVRGVLRFDDDPETYRAVYVTRGVLVD